MSAHDVMFGFLGLFLVLCGPLDWFLDRMGQSEREVGRGEDA